MVNARENGGCDDSTWLGFGSTGTRCTGSTRDGGGGDSKNDNGKTCKDRTDDSDDDRARGMTLYRGIVDNVRNDDDEQRFRKIGSKVILITPVTFVTF